MQQRPETQLALAALLIAAATVSCKPSPEKVCGHEVLVSPIIVEPACVQRVTHLQNQSPKIFESYAKCSLEAKNPATLRACSEDVVTQLATGVVIAVTSAKVTINGTAVSSNPDGAEIQKLLGDAAANTWGLDDATIEARSGIWLRTGAPNEAGRRETARPTSKVSDLGLSLAPADKNGFRGTLTIEGRTIDGKSDRATIRAIPGAKDNIPPLKSVVFLVRGKETTVSAGEYASIEFSE